jgi:hypothetical protein
VPTPPPLRTGAVGPGSAAALGSGAPLDGSALGTAAALLTAGVAEGLSDIADAAAVAEAAAVADAATVAGVAKSARETSSVVTITTAIPSPRSGAIQSGRLRARAAAATGVGVGRTSRSVRCAGGVDLNAPRGAIASVLRSQAGRDGATETIGPVSCEIRPLTARVDRGSASGGCSGMLADVESSSTGALRLGVVVVAARADMTDAGITDAASTVDASLDRAPPPTSPCAGSIATGRGASAATTGLRPSG